MDIRNLILTSIIFMIMIALGSVLYFYIKTMDTEKEITIKAGDVGKFKDLLITNKGGGHKIKLDGSDESYADIHLEIPNGGNDDIMIFAKKSVIWNGYLLTIKNVTWNGKSIDISLKKTGEPRIDKNQAMQIGNEYFLKKINKALSTSELTDDGGSYYFLGADDAGNEFSFIIDKFTGEISEIKDVDS